jgi:hypothetical protein
MSRILAGAALFSLVIAGPVLAAPKTEKQKCMSSVEIVQEMLESSDGTDKEKDMVKTLIDLSTGLCDRKRYDEAEETLSVARGIMGTEEGAGSDKDDDKASDKKS